MKLPSHSLLIAVLTLTLCATAGHGQSILFGGFDGTQTQNTISPATTTSSTGVRELKEGFKQDAGAVGAVTARIWTDQPTGKELQWAARTNTTNTLWGLSTFSTAPASGTANPYVATYRGANTNWLNFEISNTGTGDVILAALHFNVRRGLANDGLNTMTISLQQNGTFANPPVLSASDLTAVGAVNVTLVDTTAWTGYEVDLSSVSSTTLAAGGTATFRIANPAWTSDTYVDNIAISGGFVAGPVDAGTSTVVASPSSVSADGSTTSTVTVTLKDASGTLATGEGVTLANTSGPGTPTITPSGAQITDGSGVATFTVSSGTVGTEVFTATSSTDSTVVTQTASVDFQSTVVNASNSTVSASPAAVLADDTETSTITITVRNSGGLALPGKVVSLGGNRSATINPAGAGSDTTDVNGEATFTVKSASVGLEIFTATSETVTITDTASVDFLPLPVVGPVDSGNSTLIASPTAVAGDGSTTSMITVTLKDSAGLAVTGEGVTLVNTSGPGSPSISPSGALITNESGQATFLVSSATAGTEVFTATSVTDSVVVTQTASVLFTQVGATILVALLEDPVAATTSATETAPVANFYDGSETIADVGTTGSRGNTFVGSGTDSDGVNETFAHTVVYDMGTIVSFDGFVHAQRKGDGVDDVASIDFWISDTDPGDAFTTIPLPIFASQPTPDDSVNLVRNSNVLNEYLLPNGTLSGRYVVMRLNSAKTSGANPGGYTLQLGYSTVVNDYDTWDSAYSGLGLADADDDGDGLTQDEERIFGLNPQNGASANPIATPLNPDTGTFSYSRRTQSLTGLTYKTWYSTNLTDWFWESGTSESLGATVGEVEIIDVTIDPVLLAEEPNLFLRVSAEDQGAPPVIESIWGSNTSVIINFSEDMNDSNGSAANPANYTVEEDGGGLISVTNVVLSGDGMTATLTLATALSIDSAFTVTTGRIANAAGQPLGNGTSGQFQSWDNDPTGIKVFILAGQSNMVGYGSTETGNGGVAGAIGSLRYLANNNGTYPEYDYASLLENPSQPVTSPWATRGDVKAWWYNGASGNLPDGSSTPAKGDLGPPFRGANTNLIGPEYAFGQVIGDYYASDDVLIIKTSWGGHKLVSDFRPPSAVAARGGEVGASYLEMVDNVQEVLNNLGNEFPEWSGRGYEIVGFAWHQGTSDKSPAEVADEYKYNLEDLISDVRVEFGKPNLPFVIATAGMQQNGLVESSPYTGYTEVERAQLWVAGVAQPANVLSRDTRVFHEDVSVSPSTQGHHWYWNARTYFRIGKALGDDMVTLLSAP